MTYVIDRESGCRGVWANRYGLVKQKKSTASNVRPDVLVSNAGICPFAEFLTMPHATWERTRQVNLDGSFYVVQGEYSHASTCEAEILP